MNSSVRNINKFAKKINSAERKVHKFAQKSLQCSKKCSLISKTIKSTGRKFQKLTIRFSALFFYSKIGQLTNIPDFAYFMKMTKSAPSI